MSLQLTPETTSEPKSIRHSPGRAVAGAELRIRIGIADLDALLGELFKHSDGLLGVDGDVDLVAYKRRITELDSAHHDLELSVERLTDLISVGADTLLITIGRSVCHTLDRIVESAEAQVAAFEDGA